MAIAHNDAERNVIPRWRDSTITANRNELISIEPLQTKPHFSQEALFELENAWNKNPSLGTSADLLSVARISGTKNPIIEAAAEFASNNISSSPWLREISNRILNKPNIDQFQVTPLYFNATGADFLIPRIANLKYRIEIDPRNAIVRTDIARLYATLGQRRNAEEQIRIALALARNSRFVVRAAARLLIHLDEPEQAHNLLLNTESSKSDPWILAAEIAVANAAHKSSPNMKFARRLLDKNSFNPIHISELASSIASAELFSGNRQQAKKLFKIASISPTENTVAQIYWANRHHGIQIPPEIQESNMSLLSEEANAWTAYFAGNWIDGLTAAKNWLNDQPFSKRPALHSGFLSWVGNADANAAIEFTNTGLQSNPNDFNLKNNLIFYHLQANNVNEATRLANAMHIRPITPEEILVWTATSGLLAFRNGDIITGRALYLAALNEAIHLKDLRRASLAAIYMAFEEIRAKTINAQAAVLQAQTISAKCSFPEIPILQKRLNAYYDSNPTNSTSSVKR